MLDGVIEEIENGLLNSEGVYAGLEIAGGWLEFERDTVFGGDGGDRFEGRFDDFDEIGAFEFVGFTVLFDAGEIENIFDQNGEAAAFLDEVIEIFALLFGIANATALETFGHQAHGSERGAELVGDAGDEITFELVQALLFEMRTGGVGDADGGHDRGHGEESAKPECALVLTSKKESRRREKNFDSITEVFRSSGGSKEFRPGSCSRRE